MCCAVLNTLNGTVLYFTSLRRSATTVLYQQNASSAEWRGAPTDCTSLCCRLCAAMPSELALTIVLRKCLQTVAPEFAMAGGRILY